MFCADYRREGQGRIGALDLQVQLAQVWSWLSRQFTDKQAADSAISGQRLGLPPGTVQGEHQQRMKPLAHGLDAEVQRLALLQTANPGLDESEAAHLSRLPPGVLVRAAPLGFRLRPEDLVLSIDFTPANAAALARCRFATSPIALEVRGPDGRLRRVNFP